MHEAKHAARLLCTSVRAVKHRGSRATTYVQQEIQTYQSGGRYVGRCARPPAAHHLDHLPHLAGRHDQARRSVHELEAAERAAPRDEALRVLFFVRRPRRRRERGEGEGEGRLMSADTR